MQTVGGFQDAAEIRSRWGWFFIYGLVLVAVGIIALMNFVSATLVTTVWIGVLLVIGGVVELAGAFSAHRSLGGRILHIVLGILYAVGGIWVITNPALGAVTITVVLAIMLILEGFVQLWTALTESVPYRALLIVFGIVNVLLGAWLWTNIPVSALALGFYVGFTLLMAGISWIGIAWAARSAGSPSAA